MDEKTEAQPPPPAGSPMASAPETSSASFRVRQHQVYCLDRAKYLFGSYRRDDANNPDVYAAAVGLALTEYPRSVVEYATDPRTGLAAKHKFPPNVAEVKEFCDDEMARIERMSRPAPKFVKRWYEPPPRYPGCRANVLVGPASPMFALAERYTRSPNADVLNWRPDKEGRGIWLAWNVYDDLRTERRRIESWRSPSDADLRALYGRREEAPHG